jgi:hypothetical protein
MKNENAPFAAMKNITDQGTFLSVTTIENYRKSSIVVLRNFFLYCRCCNPLFLTGAAGPFDGTGIWHSTEKVDKHDHEHDHQV